MKVGQNQLELLDSTYSCGCKIYVCGSHYKMEALAFYLGVVNLIRKCFCGWSFQKDLKYDLYQVNPLKNCSHMQTQTHIGKHP
jgi:hypothetical protein